MSVLACLGALLKFDMKWAPDFSDGFTHIQRLFSCLTSPPTNTPSMAI